MQNALAWDNQYKNPELISLSNDPTLQVRNFIKWYKKNISKDFINAQVLDLGCGTGRHSFFFEEKGAQAYGFDISKTAIESAKKTANQKGSTAKFWTQSMSESYPFEENSIDIILDITSSNALTQNERANYLDECSRVLKPGGLICVRTLCLDGDKNAKNLLIKHPGTEPNTYNVPEMWWQERVFTQKDFEDTYKPYFTVLHTEKKAQYTKFQGQSYKRVFFVAYMQKNQSQTRIKTNIL